MPCTVDCLSKYGCEPIIQPENGAVYAPFVELRFNDRILTVGNSSAPPDNHIAIKSFEYGAGVGGLGVGIKVEAVDQGGVMYRQIMDALNKTTTLALSDLTSCSCRFGWIITDCNGNNRVVSNEDYGDRLYFLPLTMETNLENGLIKFVFGGGSQVARWAETRLTIPVGDQTHKISLKDALRKLFTEYDPKVKDVKFKNKDGGELHFLNSDGSKDGPYGGWPTDQQNAPAIARKWLSAVRTKDELGILMLYDPTGPYVIFQEDPIENGRRCCHNSLGTFVVNGGSCSPVLSFNPTISWTKTGVAAGGGSTAGAASGDASQIVKPSKEKKIEKAGSQSGPTVQQHEWMWRFPDDMARKNAESFSAHIEANAKYEVEGILEAELKILGRPDIVYAIDLLDKYIAIIVINPFHISTQECSWLTVSNCNKILSNKRWKINAVNHQISGGSYITTLKVSLGAQNSEFSADSPLGGSCGTETFPNSQPLTPNGT